MPDKLTILHISTRLILGGSQENTVLTCEAQARAGHHAHLAYGPIYGPEGSLLQRVTAFRADDSTRIAPHVVPSMVRHIAPTKDFRAKAQLSKLIAKLKPDVVHTHSSKAGVLGRAAAWGTKSRPAIVHTIHGPPFMPEDSALAKAKNKLYTIAERAAANRCHAIISVADAMTEQFLARGIGTRDMFTTVRSGIDLVPYLEPPADQSREAIRESLGLHPQHLVIGTIARLAQHKGHDDILDALKEDLAASPHWKLLWVGDGFWKDRLLKRAGGMGLRDRIITTGLVPPDRIPGLIRAMDILCHPSYREGLPRTVNQALLCGVPPVAYDADGTRETCINEKTGLLVPIGDRSKLRDAIKKLAGDPHMRTRLGSTGRSKITREFSIEAMMRGIDDVYERALTARAKTN
ncbi:MAG: glycosyltransferase family 4 protein [Planctomycetota bacterium]